METADIGYAIFAGIIIVSLLLGWSKTQYVKGAKMALAWILILLVVTGGVIYWDDFKNTKFYTSLVPGNAVTHADGSMEFARGSDGHFHVHAEINGQVIEFMVDTGATDIALSKEDAKRIGIDVNNLLYDKLYRTANGMTRGATVKLKNITVGNYQTGEIYASVNEGDLDSSLLGLTFLNKMKSFRVEGDKLMLFP